MSADERLDLLLVRLLKNGIIEDSDFELIASPHAKALITAMAEPALVRKPGPLENQKPEPGSKETQRTEPREKENLNPQPTTMLHKGVLYLLCPGCGKLVRGMQAHSAKCEKVPIEWAFCPKCDTQVRKRGLPIHDNKKHGPGAERTKEIMADMRKGEKANKKKGNTSKKPRISENQDNEPKPSEERVSHRKKKIRSLKPAPEMGEPEQRENQFNEPELKENQINEPYKPENHKKEPKETDVGVGLTMVRCSDCDIDVWKSDWDKHTRDRFHMSNAQKRGGGIRVIE